MEHRIVEKFLLPLTAAAARLAGDTAHLARSAQVLIFALAGLVAFLLRFEFGIPPSHVRPLGIALLVWVVAKTLVFRFYGLDRGWWRFVSLPDVIRLGMANVAGSSAAAVLIVWWAPAGFPRSVFLIDLLLCSVGTAGIRVLARLASETGHRKGAGAERTLIYGAEAAGVLLLKEIRSDEKLHVFVCGFIDDDPRKHGLRIHGVPVLGAGGDLPRIARQHHVGQVFIAMPNASGPRMAEILRQCHEAGVRSRTIPSPAEVIEGSLAPTQLREVKVEDLLGRTPVHLEQEQILRRLEGRVVLVTGAGGSIGSELCRQIARFRPGKLVAFDIAETPLFHLEREMRRRFPDLDLRPEVGSVQNPRRLEEIFRRYDPVAVFHAAAYKHVPIMEDSVFEAVENNVFGTWQVARAAERNRTETFVLISSDKAVRPTNIMGATKRLAEMVVLSLQADRTRFVAVRFGNVLGSNGSVVPIFREQIAVGGPITVTHPEMRRFFMTIPEASQLVIQASGMGNGGEIFVLDMGEPVKIVDLARDMILLSGLRPEADIGIEFTGIRPGEKLYEELNLDDESTVPTHHERIKIFAGNRLGTTSANAILAELEDICEHRDVGALVLFLKQAIPDYNPSAEILRRIVAATPVRALAAGTNGYEAPNRWSTAGTFQPIRAASSVAQAAPNPA